MSSRASCRIAFRLEVNGMLQQRVVLDLPGVPAVGEVLQGEAGAAFMVVGVGTTSVGHPLLRLATVTRS